MCPTCKAESDCQHHEIEVMINRYCKGKMPDDGDWAAYHKAFKKSRITARELAEEVYRGYSFCPIFVGRRRKADYSASWHVGLDFDSGDERSTLAYLANEDFVDYYSSFGYTTQSHTPETPKARIIWVFPEPIDNYPQYELLVQALLWRFPWADKSAKDALRLFYGSPKCTVWDNWSIFPKSAQEYLTGLYLDAHPPVVKDDTIVIEPFAVRGGAKQSRLNKLLNSVKSASNGEKHRALIKAAYTLGGYVGGGYYTESEIEDALTDVVNNHMEGIENHESAYKTIADGIAGGRRRPLYFERALTPGDVI